ESTTEYSKIPTATPSRTFMECCRTGLIMPGCCCSSIPGRFSWRPRCSIEFLDRFNGLPERHDLPQIREMDDKVLQATRTGQVMLEYENSRSMMDIIRDYYVQNKSAPAPTLRQLYTSGAYPGINTWQLTQYRGGIPRDQEMQWELVGSTSWHDVTIERFAIHHGRYLVLPLLRIRT